MMGPVDTSFQLRTVILKILSRGHVRSTMEVLSKARLVHTSVNENCSLWLAPPTICASPDIMDAIKLIHVLILW